MFRVANKDRKVCGKQKKQMEITCLSQLKPRSERLSASSSKKLFFSLFLGGVDGDLGNQELKELMPFL